MTNQEKLGSLVGRKIQSKLKEMAKAKDWTTQFNIKMDIMDIIEKRRWAVADEYADELKLRVERFYTKNAKV